MLWCTVHFPLLDGSTHSFSSQECRLLMAYSWVPKKALHPLPRGCLSQWLVVPELQRLSCLVSIWNDLEGPWHFQSFLSECLRFLLLLPYYLTLLSTQFFIPHLFHVSSWALSNNSPACEFLFKNLLLSQVYVGHLWIKPWSDLSPFSAILIQNENYYFNN